MSTPDGRLTITYNGEVYNYPVAESGFCLRRDEREPNSRKVGEPAGY